MASIPPLPKIENLQEGANDLFQVFNEDSDMHCVVIGTAYLDAALGTLLSKHLITSSVTEKMLEKPGGILTSLSARADLAYALGLIPKGFYNNIEPIVRIRNAFAHRYFHLRFEDEEIKVLVEKIKHPVPTAVLHVDGDGNNLEGLSPLENVTDPRWRFNLALIYMVSMILGEGTRAEQKQPMTKTWGWTG